MRNKIYMALVTTLLFAGCSSSDVQEFIDKQSDNFKGIIDDSGEVAKKYEGDIVATTEQEQNALDEHNTVRQAVGVSSNLRWSEDLVQAAQVYADTLSNSGAWEHDPNNQRDGYGENLYTSTQKVTLKFATKAWADEKQYYHYDDNSCDDNQMCGHYTQIVWKNTLEVGCAMSQYKTGQYKYWYLIVCKYKTPGNYVGQKPY